MSAQVEEVRLALGHIELAAHLFAPEDGLPVIALHGWLDNANSFARLAPRLKGLRIVALDLAGHGYSEHRPPGAGYALADYAHDARTISDYLTKRIRHTGARNLLRTPEMKAKYPHIDNQPRDGFDSVSLDGIDSDGYVGKVKKGGEVVGRIDIGGDGKAMVFVGASGDQPAVCQSLSRGTGAVRKR